MPILAGLGGFLSGTAAADSCSETYANSLNPETIGVVEVLPAGTLKLEGGTELKLAGILLPGQPLDPKAKDARRRYQTALEELGALAAEKRVRRTRKPSFDRHKRELSQVFLASGGWLQAELVSSGFARVEPETPGTACVDELLRLEAEARQGGAGLRADPAFQIQPAWATRRLRRLEHTFQIVEGKVGKVAKTRRFTYLNFGKDWRTDFTASISSRALRRLAKIGFDPSKLERRTVRIRGWITYRNGPMIEISQAAQIEQLQKQKGPDD